MLEVAQILSHFIHIMLVFPWCFSGASVVLNSQGLGPKGLRRGKGGSKGGSKGGAKVGQRWGERKPP